MQDHDLIKGAPDSIYIYVLAFSDPQAIVSEPQKARVKSCYSVKVRDIDIRSLSITNATEFGNVQGLLYVPSLHPDDPCVDASRPFLLSNVTRLNDLPGRYDSLVAFVPWISALCTKSYLAASAAGTKAFLTYLPEENTDDWPFDADNAVWDEHNGELWKAQYNFSVYAIPGSKGAAAMQQLGQYSGNWSNAKIEDIIAQERLGPTDYLRLYASFDPFQPDNSSPPWWGWLIIVFGLIATFVGCLILAIRRDMRIRRRRRQDLERRIANGEVTLTTLATLGVLRSRLSQAAIESFGTSRYTSGQHNPSTGDATASQSTGSTTLNSPFPSPNDSQFSISEPSCVICDEEFSTDDEIRTLPCLHFFHPHCIDPYLRHYSSLCPLCRARVEPANPMFNLRGPITDDLVRRQRRLRRGREANTSSGRRAGGQGNRSRLFGANFWRRFTLGGRTLNTPAGPTAVTSTGSAAVPSAGPAAVLPTGPTAMPPTDPIEMNVLETSNVSDPQTAASSAQRDDVPETPAAEGRGSQESTKETEGRASRESAKEAEGSGSQDSTKED